MNFQNKILFRFSNFTKSYAESKLMRKVYKRFNWLMIKVGANPIVTAKMQDGTSVIVDLSTRTERDCYYTGLYDSKLIGLLKSMFQNESTFLDVGANIGFYSVAISKSIKASGVSSKVLSFEPFEGNFKRLKKNIELNELQSICLPNNYGLSNETKTTEITLREDFKNGSKTGNAAIPTGDDFDKGFARSQIKLKQLDKIWDTDFNTCPRIDLIKADIEGHEDFFLKGANAIIGKHRPTILMEINKPYYVSRGVDLDEVFMPLIPKNYIVYREDNDNWIRVKSLHNCDKVDNVFIVPKEKLDLKGYGIFQNINS